MTTSGRPSTTHPRSRDPRVLAQLDELLADVCAALQISDAQYNNAKDKYESVGRWLAAPESPIARLKPIIFPQGSMALQTTVRPWTDEDSYDLDLVLQIESTSDDPMTLYRLVERRLRNNARYADIIEPKRRCLALNFVGDDHAFHMDILPARADNLRGGECIEVPDRSTPERWQPSNPKGYREWFESRATYEAILLAERKQEPLPDHAPAHARAVLKRAVQLLKRRRDLMIHDDELSPRSVVLTTLAARHYRGEQHVVPALLSILSGIRNQVEDASPGRIEVPNPTNPDEYFCESFKTQEQYETFVEFINAFEDEMLALAETVGFASLQPALSKLFGEKITKRVLLEYAERISAARERGDVRYGVSSGEGGLLIGTASQPARTSATKPTHRAGGSVPSNTFHGE